MSIFRKILLVALAAIALTHRAFADSPSVTAVLTSSEAAVGQMVQMQLRLTGARSANVPSEIAVDGLEIRQTGTEQHYEMNNFSVTQSVNYNYTILPLKAGTFKIPPQAVQVGGKSVHTPELTLHVIASSSRQTPNSAGGGSTTSIDPSKLVTAEMIVPKKDSLRRRNDSSGHSSRILRGEDRLEVFQKSMPKDLRCRNCKRPTGRRSKRSTAGVAKF